MLDNTSTVANFYGDVDFDAPLVLKSCRKCKTMQPLENFSKDKYRKDGLDGTCRECKKLYRKENLEKCREMGRNHYVNNLDQYKEYRRINADKIQKYKIENSEVIKEKKKKYCIKNADKIKEYNKQFRIKNAIKLKQRYKIYNKKNKEKRQAYFRMRRNTDVSFRLRSNLSRRINYALKSNSKTKSTLCLLGCPIVWLKLHLESKFYNRADGTPMSWDNYKHDGWHMDHIKPCASFNLLDLSEQQKCFHWTNLQPLWAEDNIAKSDKIL